MNEQQALSLMIPPAGNRPGKPYRGGVIQIHLTRACNLSCFGCTQGSNLAGKTAFMSLEHFEQACLSLKGYFGVVGIFGGCPTLHPRFPEICEILAKHIPFEQRGLWANAPFGYGGVCRKTFNPAVSNLNVHLDQKAYDEFKRDWPECNPVGLTQDSRHSPPYVALKDVIPDEGQRWELISTCDINRYWSAMIGVFRGELRAWFCEVAGAQAMLHQDEPDYPDTGILIPQGEYEWREIHDGMEIISGRGMSRRWWDMPMRAFAHQVRKHCHECGVPLRGRGELAQAQDGVEQTSLTHIGIFKTKRKRTVQIVENVEQLGTPLTKMTDYLGNAR